MVLITDDESSFSDIQSSGDGSVGTASSLGTDSEFEFSGMAKRPGVSPLSLEDFRSARGSDVLLSAEPQKALKATMIRNAVNKTGDGDGSRATNRSVPRKRAGQSATVKGQIDYRLPPAVAQRRRSKTPAKAKASKAKAPAVSKAGPDFGGFGRFENADALGQKRSGAFPGRRQQWTNRKDPVPGRSRYDDNKSGDVAGRFTPHAITRQDKDRQVKIVYGNRRKSDGPESSEQKEIAKANSELMKRILNAKPSVPSFRKK